MKKSLTLLCFLVAAFAFGLFTTNSVKAFTIPEVEVSVPAIPEVGLSMPIHGNWCGAGHGGTSLNDPYPVDTLDRGCMNHDLCYMKNGYFNAGCDRALLDYIDTHKQFMGSGERFKASLVYATFALSKLRN